MPFAGFGDLYIAGVMYW